MDLVENIMGYIVRMGIYSHEWDYNSLNESIVNILIC